MSKFILPTQKGLELFPEAIVAPPSLRWVGVDANSPESQAILSQHGSALSAFHAQQAHNHSLSGNIQSRAERVIAPNLSVTYVNQGGKEFVTLYVKPLKPLKPVEPVRPRRVADTVSEPEPVPAPPCWFPAAVDGQLISETLGIFTRDYAPWSDPAPEGFASGSSGLSFEFDLTFRLFGWDLDADGYSGEGVVTFLPKNWFDTHDSSSQFLGSSLMSLASPYEIESEFLFTNTINPSISYYTHVYEAGVVVGTSDGWNERFAGLPDPIAPQTPLIALFSTATGNFPINAVGPTNPGRYGYRLLGRKVFGGESSPRQCIFFTWRDFRAMTSAKFYDLDQGGPPDYITSHAYYEYTLNDPCTFQLAIIGPNKDTGCPGFIGFSYLDMHGNGTFDLENMRRNDLYDYIDPQYPVASMSRYRYRPPYAGFVTDGASADPRATRSGSFAGSQSQDISQDLSNRQFWFMLNGPDGVPTLLRPWTDWVAL